MNRKRRARLPTVFLVSPASAFNYLAGAFIFGLTAGLLLAP